MEGLSLLLKESQSAGLLTGISVSRAIKILHILFVDDVVILTKATMQEWWEIDKILNFFYLTSGLQINIVKSTFHHAGLTKLDLNVFKVVFPFKFISMDLGFKYLGFYLKAGAQRLEEWNWLLKFFEKRINNWCYRWLSL